MNAVLAGLLSSRSALRSPWSPALLSLAFVLTLGLGVGLAGCGKRGSDVERATKEATLLVGSGPEAAALDPHLVTGATEFSILGALFEGLVDLDGQTLEPIPGLAERWEISADRREYTFHLRANARWSDGSTITAPQCVDSWRRLLTKELGAYYSYLLDPVAGAAEFRAGNSTDFSKVGVSAIDDRTLRVVLAQPMPAFLTTLAMPPLAPVPVDAIRRAGEFAKLGNPWTEPARFVSSGPFHFVEWRRNQSILVRKSPMYWDAAAVALKEIRFVTTEDLDAEERMFRAGQLHVTAALPLSRLESYRRENPGVLRNETYFGTDFFRVNVSRPEFADVRVRRALSLAIDRTAIAQRVLRGQRKPATTFVPPGLRDYEPARGVPMNFSAARELLVESGHTNGAGLPPIEILFNTSEQHRAVAEAVQEMWRRELGVSVVLLNQENKVLQQTRAAGQYQIVRSSWVGDYLDAMNFLEVFTSASANNHTRWSDAGYDRLIAAARAEADPTKRSALLREAEQRLLDAAVIIPIYHNASSYLVRPEVRGWYGNLMNRRPWKGVSLLAQ